jgi:putative phosphoribosyl transferase
MNLSEQGFVSTEARIPAGRKLLAGMLSVPAEARGVVVFVHGSGSSRHSPRNQYVARILHEARLGTLLFDLLTAEEEQEEQFTRHLRFDIPLLAERLKAAADWLAGQGSVSEEPLGYFGSSTGAAAALVAAAEAGRVRAVVSRGGRPDLAGEALERVAAPTLLIVGGRDSEVIQLNEQAYERLRCRKALRIIPGATHLFEEPGALERVAHIASEWFAQHLRRETE